MTGPMPVLSGIPTNWDKKSHIMRMIKLLTHMDVEHRVRLNPAAGTAALVGLGKVLVYDIKYGGFLHESNAKKCHAACCIHWVRDQGTHTRGTRWGRCCFCPSVYEQDYDREYRGVAGHGDHATVRTTVYHEIKNSDRIPPTPV